MRAGTEVIDKPGRMVSPDELLLVLEDPNPYVSRGGLKLRHALRRFGIDPTGMRALDIGASTGGFTDCLLQAGAEGVVAVDVGYGQLDWKLQQDERVRVVDRTNARELTLEAVGGEPFDLAVVDVSFISLKLILPRIFEMMHPGGQVVALVKPQFEVGRQEVEHQGVIKDPGKHYKAVVAVGACVETHRWGLADVTASPILGQKGNREFFIHCTRASYGQVWESGALSRRIMTSPGDDEEPDLEIEIIEE